MYSACVDCGVEKTGGQRRTQRCRPCSSRRTRTGSHHSLATRQKISRNQGGDGDFQSRHRVWARAVKERDGWRCVCGYQGVKGKRDVDSHHIVPRAADGPGMDLSAALSNGITLCKSCHALVHRKSRPAAPALALLYDTAQEHSRPLCNSLNLNHLAPSAVFKDVSSNCNIESP